MTTFTLGYHIQDQANKKGISLEKIAQVLATPSRITDVTRYPGQKRYIGQGIAVIVDPIARKAITVYLDGVFTPLRPDQIAAGEVIRRTH